MGIKWDLRADTLLKSDTLKNIGQRRFAVRSASCLPEPVGVLRAGGARNAVADKISAIAETIHNLRIQLCLPCDIESPI